MYEIAICDDDTVFSTQFKKQLSDILESRDVSCRLTTFTDTASLRSAIESGHKYHLLFLDIVFGTEEGLHFARRLREEHDPTDIIFITTNADYAVDAYDVSPPALPGQAHLFREAADCAGPLSGKEHPAEPALHDAERGAPDTDQRHSFL